MSFNYLTIGYDCSPAAALKGLNLREFALPFDWTVSNIKVLQMCFENKFKDFHTNLTFNYNKTRLIDHYGFQFPHDYPLKNMTNFENNIGEGVFGEENGNCITENWYNYYSIVLNKYNRRIERFNNIINDTKPIIVLCRYNTKDVLELQKLFIKYYKNNNIYFVNSCNELFENDYIKNIYTEKENKWNDINIWNEGISNIIKKIK
jgi:hypothetical protein